MASETPLSSLTKLDNASRKAGGAKLFHLISAVQLLKEANGWPSGTALESIPAARTFPVDTGTGRRRAGCDHGNVTKATIERGPGNGRDSMAG